MGTQSRSALIRAIRSIALTTTTAAAIALSGVNAAEAATVTLKVVKAGTNTTVDTYKYLINVDNTGTTAQRSPDPGTGCNPIDAGYPASCKWTSIAGVPGSSPIYTQGDQSDFPTGLPLPDGRYLVSVLADGHKLDGRHFTVAGSSVTWQGKALGDPAGEVKVELQPFPLPDAQIQAAVFEDISPTNSAPDLPAEHGLAGFQAHIVDYLGEVTTDVYGAPLCGTGKCLSACYVVSNGVDVGTVAPIDAKGRCPTDATGLTMLEGGLAPADSAVEGKVKIPNLGPNRYSLSVTPPNGSGWIQTTTLEGNHDWDAWVMEGATGLDTEFVIAGEPFPAIIFGYVQPTNTVSGSGQVKGLVAAFKAYVPAKAGVGSYEPMIGAKLDKPINRPWIALSDLQAGDTAVWIGQGNADGTFTIPNVAPGTYTLSWWDEPQNYILNLMNVTVGSGETVDLGVLPLNGWWTRIEGYVFDDANRNGVMDPGEVGLPGYTLTFRKRENSLMDRGATVITTDATGHYVAENTYPMTQWLVLEAYDDLHYTTGVTFQSDNQPTPTTHLGAGVDVSVLPIIGLGGRIDWGKHAYDATGANGIDPRNGGIVGTVSYDTTRNELNPQFAAAEDWQPGVSGLTINLYAPVACPATPPAGGCDASGRYVLDADGSFLKGPLLNTYVTEAWQRPGNKSVPGTSDQCTPRDVDGNPLAYPTDQQVTNSDQDCLEGPLMGVQFATYATDQGTPDANFGATVDGNYGFGDGCFVSTTSPVVPGVFNPDTGVCTTGSFAALPGGLDYLVEVAIPNDARGRPLYKVTREEDINIGNGDEFVTPAVPPPACVGPLHTVDSSGNATFPGGPGTSPYEGQQKPLCNVKLVQLSNGKSVVPVFNVYTDVPIPARMWGLIVDDLNFSSNPKSLLYGEKAGVAFAPVGVYDYTNRLITTVESDYNGLWDVLLPSSNRINCPTPSGVCANLYRFVGNDPGIPGQLNPNYKPQYRTIAAEFEAIPGLLVPADLAPTQVGVSIQLPGGQFSQVSCSVNDPDPTKPLVRPELFAVSQPYAVLSGSGTPSFTITGQGFGADTGANTVTLNGVPLTVNSWSDTQIRVTIPSSTAAGPQQLMVTTANGQSTVNGLTFHVIKGTYSPTVREVGPGKTYPTIQAAIDAPGNGNLVVVYPGTPTGDRTNPRGAYYENLIISKPVKLQGVGPGGIQRAGNVTVRGSIVDGSAYGGDTDVAEAWRTRVEAMSWVGNQTVSEGEVIFIVATSTGQYSATSNVAIDGFDIRGGDQQGQANIITQGGAIFANAYVRNLQITNNLIEANSSSYGTIRIGTPDLTPASNFNENLRIANNRVIHNAGTNLAGAIGVFAGSNNYEIAGNDVCGNFSAEYGGGISAIGMSPGGSIHDNRIYFNQSYDEGGGIIIAGQLPANPTALSPGSGAVRIYNNLIQANMANDDGGGLRFLMAGNFPMEIYNNFIVNNVSTHEGGGVSLDDTPNVRFYNNTVMKNLTTATAVTSNGLPAPAGLATARNSDQLQATLPAGSPTFSSPLLFNNIFWDNRAGTRSPTGNVIGLGAAGDVTPINYWDMGAADGSGSLEPTNSILQVGTGTVPSPTNSSVDPAVTSSYDVSVAFSPWRNNPAFVGAIMVTVDLPPNLLGNYHLASNASPAYNTGAASKATPVYQQPPASIAAPTTDIDNQARPAFGAYDIGADEIPQPTAQLQISKSDGVSVVTAGGSVTYTIIVRNFGPDAANGATVTDTMPATLTGVTWTCSADSGSSCGAASGSGNISATVDLPNGGRATFTVSATVAPSATGTLSNTASVAVPAGMVDPNPSNNSNTDTDTIAPPLPSLAVLDDFNRANAANLGANWSQPNNNIRLNTNQANENNGTTGFAYWNGSAGGGPTYGAKQGAAFAMANGTIVSGLNGNSLILKASGGTATAPQSYIRVRIASSTVVVETTTNSGGSFTNRGTLSTAAFASGNTLTAVANADGSVDVWRNATWLGRVTGTTFTGTGRIGMMLINGARADNFAGGTL